MALCGVCPEALPSCLSCLQLAWQQGEVVAAAWATAAELLLHPHAWVRMAAGRLLGLAFAEPKIGDFCSFSYCCTTAIAAWFRPVIQLQRRLPSVWLLPLLGFPACPTLPDCKPQLFLWSCLLEMSVSNPLL